MQYTQKYTLVSFVDYVEVADEFNMQEWPLHVTLADVFAVDQVSAEIGASLKNLLTSMSPVTVKAIENSVLGDSPVVLLEKEAGIAKLHKNIIDLLEANGAVFNTPEYNLGGFIPHCTQPKKQKISKGDAITINTLSLIDMFPNNNWQHRKVLGTFTLQG